MNMRPFAMASPLPAHQHAPPQHQQPQQQQMQVHQQLLQQHLQQQLQPAPAPAPAPPPPPPPPDPSSAATSPASSEAAVPATETIEQSDLRPTTDAPGAFRQCPHCLETVPKAGMKKHLLKEHRNISLDCPHCGRHFKMRHHLRQHIVGTHLKLKNYACRYCSYTSTQSSPVITHERVVHLKLKLYECYHEDGFSTNNGPSIKSHLKKEHGVQEPAMKEEVKLCRVSFAKKKPPKTKEEPVVVKSEPQVLSASVKDELINNELNSRNNQQPKQKPVAMTGLLPQVPLPTTHLLPQAHSILAAAGSAFPMATQTSHLHHHQHHHQHLLVNGMNNGGGNNVAHAAANNTPDVMNSFFCKRCSFSSADGHVFLRHIKDVHLVEHPQFL